MGCLCAYIWWREAVSVARESLQVNLSRCTSCVASLTNALPLSLLIITRNGRKHLCGLCTVLHITVRNSSFALKWQNTQKSVNTVRYPTALIPFQRRGFFNEKMTGRLRKQWLQEKPVTSPSRQCKINTRKTSDRKRFEEKHVTTNMH